MATTKQKIEIKVEDRDALVEIFQQIEIDGYIHTNEGYPLFNKILQSKPIQEVYDIEKFKSVLNYFKENGLRDVRNGDPTKKYLPQLIIFFQGAFKKPDDYLKPNNTIKLQKRMMGDKDLTKKTIKATDREYYNQFAEKIGNDLLDKIEECRDKDLKLDTGYDDLDLEYTENKLGCSVQGCRSGYIKKSDNTWDYCNCYKEEIKRVRLVKSGIPKDYFPYKQIKTENLSCYSKMYGNPTNTAKSIDINKFINNFNQNINIVKSDGWNMILEGPTGSFKTTLACILGKYALQHNYTVLFVEMQKLRKIWTGEKLIEELENIKSKLYSVDFLILDDLGQEYMSLQSDYQNSEIDLLLRERISDKKCTIITTNAKENEIRTRYQERVYSLLQKKFIHIIMNTKVDVRKENEVPNFLFD